MWLSHKRHWSGQSGAQITYLGPVMKHELTHPRISPMYLESIEDPQAQFHILVCVIKEETYLLINIYSDPDTHANAEATMNRVLD